ncbi:MAG: TonB-dependent receptor, partial [Candidatus Aminicenantes bacterium]|nr:TonB-dependent receptor [Candidatus Aminicenantes bacterium]
MEPSPFSSPFSSVLVGTVTDRGNRAPLPGCRVVVLETALAASTDADGRYRLENVPRGAWQVLFEKDGYMPQVRRVRAEGPAGAEVRADADLEPLTKEVTVVADAFTRTETDASSRRELSGQQVREIPGTFEDITRAIQVLPGVAATGDFKNDLIVRGGSPAENMFMIDMVQVPGLSHFGSQNSGGGAMGLLGASVVQDLEFFSGGFPAYYGDKLSSVTRVRLKEGDRKRLHGQAAFSLLGAGLNAEGPLFSERGSWLVSGRKDYFSVIPRDWTIDLTVVPDFEDVLAKAAYDITSAVQVSILGLYARDSLHIEEADDPPDRRMKIDIGDGLDVAGATVKALLGRGGVAYFTLSRTDNRYTYRLVSGGLERYTIRSDDDETTGRVDVEYFVLPKLQVLGGASYKRLEARHRMYYRGGYLVIDRMGFRYTRVDTDRSLSSGKTAAYLQASFPVTARLKATAGLRYDDMTYIRRRTMSPRFGLAYAFGPATSVHASYGIHYQSPETFWLASHPANAALLPVKSEHFVLGGEHDFGGALRVRA